jgi:nitrogen fixation protein FixH
MNSTPFTGRKAFAVIGGGFAIVIAVNVALAVLSSRSHPGLVVDNSYVASQKFNSWLEQGRAQKALGWTVKATADPLQLRVTATNALGAPLTGLTALASLEHPLGAEPTRNLPLVETAPGIYSAPHGLTAGQWLSEVRLSRGNDRYYLATRLQIEKAG